MRKETVDIDILVVTSRNGDREIIQSVRITSRSNYYSKRFKNIVDKFGSEPTVT